MRVLVACESSGTVREAFRARGHDAWSADLQPADDGSPFHLQGDVLPFLTDDWDLLIAHPPCTLLSSSGQHWNEKLPHRTAVAIDAAVEFARAFFDAPVEKIAVENPVGILSTLIRKPTQIIQPHDFGEDASKSTCLWLKGLRKLEPTGYVEPRWVMGPSGKLLPRWANQTDSGQNRLPPSAGRWKARSRTYPGIAEAMAAQWG